MDIRTKLFFALVTVALGSMLVFGALMYGSADRLLSENTRNHLDGQAESRKEALEEVISGWHERVQLIASRTQLRLSLRAYDRSGDPDELSRIRRILGDAIGSVNTVTSLAVYDPEGQLVLHVATGGEIAPPAMALASEPSAEAAFRGVSRGADEEPRVVYLTDLVLEGERIGALLVLLNGQELVDLTQDYTGLGETGEVLIVARDGSEVRTLHPVRRPDGESSTLARLGGLDDPVIRALEGEEGVYTDGLTDYRGESVWAATRYLPETNWGLVVKVDAAEQRAPITEFRGEMVRLALSLSAFAILGAVLLGLRFANPIHDLAETANQIRLGRLEARAKVKREDEIGLLARTFNRMADELEERMTLLHEFERVFELARDMLCIAGTDGYFKRTNPAFERTLGWRTEELLERPFFDLVHPDDLDATRQEIDKLSRGIPTISFVNRFRCADGSYKCLRWTSHPEPDTGLLYAVAREISDPRQS